MKNFNEIVDCCIDHLIDNREDIDREDLTRKELTKIKGGLNHYIGKKNLKKTTKESPILYIKIDYSKKNDIFFTCFYDRDDNKIDARTLIDKSCFAESAIKIESIFICNNISLQHQLNDATIDFTEMKNENICLMTKSKTD